MSISTFKLRAGQLLFFIFPLMAVAQTVYIDNKVMVGLHQDKDVDSAIIKLLPGGGALEVLKRDTPLTQVKEPGGASGWIDNRYLVDSVPVNEEVLKSQKTIARLEAEISALKKAQNTASDTSTSNQKLNALSKENAELKQQLQSEQLKSGEFQAQAAELRNQLSRKIGTQDTAAAENTGGDHDSATSGNSGWFTALIGIICIITGLAGGAWYMDWHNRSRHGGFRI